MRALVSSELLKLRTTRTFWWLAIAAGGLSLLFTIAQLIFENVTTEDQARLLLSNMTSASILLTVLGVVGSAGEYRHRTITTTLLAAPRRTRVVVAKGIAYGLAGLMMGLIAATVVLAVALPWLSADGNSLGSLGVDGGELAAIIAGALALSALSACFGVGLGLLIANQIGAVMSFVVLIFIIDPALGALVEGYGRFSLGGLSSGMTGVNPEEFGIESLFAPGVSGLIFLGYVMALLAAAAAALSRRDVA